MRNIGSAAWSAVNAPANGRPAAHSLGVYCAALLAWLCVAQGPHLHLEGDPNPVKPDAAAGVRTGRQAAGCARAHAAAAVAAHECGHAVQHATAYSWLELRSQLVPVVNIASNYVQWILIGGIFMMRTFPSLLLIGIVLFAATTLFSIITLPVEYDASNRALAWLENKNMLTSEEQAGAKDALKWAARTYVVAAIGSIATLLYYIMIYMNRR